MLLPTADILIVERRVCQQCGNAVEAASPRSHRLYHTPRGEPAKRAMLHREPTDMPLGLRTVHRIEVPIDACQQCWNANISYESAISIIPNPPPPVPLASPSRPLGVAGLKESLSKRPAPSLEDILDAIITQRS